MIASRFLNNNAINVGQYPRVAFLDADEEKAMEVDVDRMVMKTLENS